ncbi:MAG: hypothetical protein INH37_09550 [Myxococcaceae bacterium]|nr:hypothetical protein [Myxococcaceae bacterium]
MNGDLFIFGGLGGGTSIVRFRPSDGGVSTMNSQIPSGRYNMGLATVGDAFFLVGGAGQSQILKYEPLVDRMTVLMSGLPSGKESPDCFYDGAIIHCLGGNISTDVIRIDPRDGGLSFGSMGLPLPAWGPAFFVLNGSGWLYGGQLGMGAPLTSVTRYEPLTGSSTVFTNVPVLPHHGRSAVTVGNRAYIIGGSPAAGSPMRDTIVRFELR